VAVEIYTADATGVRGTSVVRSPRTLVREYALTLTADGRPQQYRVVARRPDGTTVQELVLDYGADSVIAQVRRDTARQRVAVASTERPVPFYEDLMAVWEAALPRAGETVAVLGGREVIRFPVERRADGTVAVRPPFETGPMVFRFDAQGRLQGVDMSRTTAKFAIERVPSVDVRALAAEFGRRDQAGQGLGVFSPRDTASSGAEGAKVRVDYGRPSARGRQIFGGIVPFGEVWRTGANEATQLFTDRDLEIGGTRVPAGTYSLWTVPGREKWTLIVNKQHGQWGTEYDEKQDLARIDMAVKRLSAPVERFTVSLDGGALVFSWADTQASVPLRVR
jgi:hypothetical protein